MTLPLTPLTAIAPVDGRYHRVTRSLAPFFSESALMRYRVLVEVEYFIALCELPLPALQSVPAGQFDALRELYRHFSQKDAQRIKDLEAVTNHDVKAVEYYLKEAFDTLNLEACKEYIHFGLTSQDINNTAQPLALKAAWQDVLAPALNQVLENLQEKAEAWRAVPMLARTHGQPASPTTMGKELAVFVERLTQQLALLADIPFCAKFGGATGNFNAHLAAFPDINWPAFADELITSKLGLKRLQTTTQIEHYDNLGAFCDAVKRLNAILMDLSQDMWLYIALNYFQQRIAAGEVGSSAMPHKVNPIDFENAEGNAGVANALLEFLARKLPVSRLQRDLTDSTVARNLGVPLGHTLITLTSLKRGLNKLILNETVIRQDLEQNWAVVAEALQTILRREGYPQPYEALKALTRTHAAINQQTLHDFITSLNISEAVKAELQAITPHTYLGTSADI